jgi:hypothetical protein
MKKYLVFTAIFLLFLMACPAFGLDVSVDIKGSQDLMSLKDGLARTINARCLAKNVTAEGNAALNVSIFQMGSTISLDAILSSKPPKAFHRDLKSADELSGAIDAMIAELFTPAPPAAVQANPQTQAAQALARSEMKLPFAATSLVFLKDTLFVSSEDAIYRVEGGKEKSWWKVPRGLSIYRLYPYRDAILAVASDNKSIFSYLVRDGKTVKSWNRCVTPSKDGLISSRLYTDVNLPYGVNHWSKPETEEGTPAIFPEGTDILSTWTGDVLPSKGEETIGFDRFLHLAVFSGREALWTSDDNFSTLPFYVMTRNVGANNSQNDALLQQDAETRYYFLPRVLLKGSGMVTFANHELASGLFSKVKMYDSTRIVAFTPVETEFTARNLTEIKGVYCADIALDKGSVLALVVKKSTSYIQRYDLQ